jgi:hypothetical protein
MADYIRDLRPAKWGSMTNLGVGCSNSGRALALPATDAAVVGTSALCGRQRLMHYFFPRKLGEGRSRASGGAVRITTPHRARP